MVNFLTKCLGSRQTEEQNTKDCALQLRALRSALADISCYHNAPHTKLCNKWRNWILRGALLFCELVNYYAINGFRLSLVSVYDYLICVIKSSFQP
jgi:hypothetical protein